jgi:hypothetical protein
MSLGVAVRSDVARYVDIFASIARLLTAAALLGSLFWFNVRLSPRKLEPVSATLLPALTFDAERPVLAVPGKSVVAEVAHYDDELFAFLMAGYLRGTRTFRDAEVLLNYRNANHRLAYCILIRPAQRDLAAGLYLLYSAKARGLIKDADWHPWDNDTIQEARRQNAVFEAAYNFPVRRRLEHLSRQELIGYASRFVRFKSASDPRTWRRGVASLAPLASVQAEQLAADVVTVAEFFSLPLDFFLGIGAMENNYMNADGDREHTAWKRRPEFGDVVLKRAGGRVLVVNSSQGVWQITRETLRYSHKLYLADQRDYSVLPQALRPPRDLDPNHVEPRVLTVYAGLLFRELLDRCGGDVKTALGAYNGGLKNPNMTYAAGVSAAAHHARSVMEHAAILSGTVIGRRFVVATDANRVPAGPTRP